MVEARHDEVNEKDGNADDRAEPDGIADIPAFRGAVAAIARGRGSNEGNRECLLGRLDGHDAQMIAGGGADLV
jgi:hypothetical protein